jgi:hypothetical protein
LTEQFETPPPSAHAGLFDRVLVAWHIDLSPAGRPPALGLVAVAACVSIALSIAADAGVVRATNALFPETTGFSHFRIADYATLTSIGIVVACLAWPIVSSLSSTPRWLFLRLATGVTVVLWVPDFYLIAKGESPRAVLALMVMHLLIALITYNSLVRIAPLRGLIEQAVPGTETAPSQPLSASPLSGHLVWVSMTVAVSIEFAIGVIALLVVPFSRPDGWIPDRSKAVYLVHAGFGVLLLLAACGVLVATARMDRRTKLAALGGLAGIVVGAAGGLLAVAHAVRLVGLALMFVGTGIAFFGYLVPLVEPEPDPEDLSRGKD